VGIIDWGDVSGGGRLRPGGVLMWTSSAAGMHQAKNGQTTCRLVAAVDISEVDVSWSSLLLLASACQRR
jgi:hypothetical protein